MSARRPWTDEELGFIQDRIDWPANRIADELGRSESSVRSRRWHLRRGRYSVLEPWSEDEDEVLLRLGDRASAQQLVHSLPGRSIDAIRGRRKYLGIQGPHRRQIDPHTIGARPLIAKTCTSCGRLLQADWFDFATRERVWKSDCRKCKAARTKPGKNREPLDVQKIRIREFNQRMKQITEPRAHRNMEPYTEQDHYILADPDLALLQKALRLGRTYAATRRACAVSGYKSHVGLGEPTDLWRIFNPNEPERVAA